MQLSPFFLSSSFQSKHEAQYEGNKWRITIVEFDHNLDYFHCLRQKMPMGHICDYKQPKSELAYVKSTMMLFNPLLVG
jgi:hypothetical protein